MSFQFSEDDLEQVALKWFEGLGYSVKNGRDSSDNGIMNERESNKDVVLDDRLEAALRRINPELNNSAIEQAMREISIEKSPSLLENNRSFHEMITNGIEVEHYNDDGETINDLVYVFDFDNPGNNDFLAVNQLTVVNGEYKKRPDIVLFINGLPVVVIELKNSTNESVGIEDGYHQLETYKMRIPQLFNHNAVLVTSDGINTKAGSLTADYDRFMTWRTKDGKTEDSSTFRSLDILIHGMLNKEVLLDLIRHFVLFQDDDKGNIVLPYLTYRESIYLNYEMLMNLQFFHL